jgi:hypothetical protein
VLGEQSQADLPLMLTEFGGIALKNERGGTWGYSVSDSAREFARQYDRLLTAVRSLGLLAGFCYTQFSDTYQEANGLLHADRTPKFPLREIAAATAGPAAKQQEIGLEQVLNTADASETR